MARLMQARCLAIAGGALSALLAVAGGAIGSHLLRDRVTPDALAVFDTANHYQMIHSLALIVVGALHAQRLGARWLDAAAACFAGGILLFCGSLYARVVFGERAYGALAPFGGSLLMLGWLALAIAALRHER